MLGEIGKGSRVVALIVGINRTRSSSSPDLRYAVKDANDFLGLIDKVSSSQRNSIRVLLDADATTQRVDNMLNAAVAEAGPGAVLVVYLSTRGFSSNSSGLPQSRLAMFDTDLASPDPGIALDYIESRLRSAEADSKWLFVDASSPLATFVR
jgi:hypothetical protein